MFLPYSTLQANNIKSAALTPHKTPDTPRTVPVLQVLEVAAQHFGCLIRRDLRPVIAISRFSIFLSAANKFSNTLHAADLVVWSSSSTSLTSAKFLLNPTLADERFPMV